MRWATPQLASRPANRSQKLATVIASDVNGFEHESALIKLALGLLDLGEREEGLSCYSPSAVTVKPSGEFDWAYIYKPEVKKLHCDLKRKTQLDPRFEIPSWICGDIDRDECEKVYWVGMILRAAAVGGADFTGNRWKQSKVVGYKGIRTNLYKRRIGMMHSPEALIGEYSTLSSWSSELLMRCLQWPGFEASYLRNDDIKAVVDISTLKGCLSRRLRELDRLYCKSSQLPLLPTRIERGQLKDRCFRVVTVQQLLPRERDFSAADVELNNRTIRSRHQKHLRSVCALTIKTLAAKRDADGVKENICADLIVFPEVSVHPDDFFILQQLARKTQSLVFAGFVFSEKGGKLVNKARWFLPDDRPAGRLWHIRDQGKQHMTANEKSLGISSYRPVQHLIEVHGHGEGPFRLTGAICYDATDIELAADMREKSDLFVIVAHNRDVNTFDNMAAAFQYHMYQHVVIGNIGEFGGSTIQAPYKQSYDKMISHSHGGEQIAINMADIDLAAFRRSTRKHREVKYKPAGMN